MNICDEVPIVAPERAKDLDWIWHLGVAYRKAYPRISKEKQKLVASNDFWGLKACGMIAVTRSSFMRQWMCGYRAATHASVPPPVLGSVRCV